MDIDFVVTYVDNSDPVWIDQISKWNTEIDKSRYRSWDNFRYWFRGVEKNVSFVRKVHLVVASESQVPDWIDQSKVNVVFHRDIIPEHLLPTFNSTTIEMFLWKISGLAEHFVYFNDDMFCMNKMSENDFFRDGKPVYQLVRRNTYRNLFRMQCMTSYKMAGKALGKKLSTSECFCIKHSADPMLVSSGRELFGKVGAEIIDRCTRFREPFNCTQYLFPDYEILKGNYVEDLFDYQYCSLVNQEEVRQLILNGTHKAICLNDTNRCKDFDVMKLAILESFEKKYPDKSRFEK